MEAAVMVTFGSNAYVCMQLIVKAASRLDECQMIRFEEHSGAFGITDLGRVASHFYIQVRKALLGYSAHGLVLRLLVSVLSTAWNDQYV